LARSQRSGKWVGAGHDPTRSVFSLYRFDADPIVYRLTKPLFAAQIALGRLHGRMAKHELNLFQFTAGGMTEPQDLRGRDVRVSAYLISWRAF